MNPRTTYLLGGVFLAMLVLVALAVFSTALAFAIYFRLIQTLGAIGTTAQAYLRVPIGVAIGVLLIAGPFISTVVRAVLVFDGDAGVLEHDLKELTRAYIAHTIECGY